MDMITINPEESHEVIVNPGMGWTTFFSFNGDEVNQGHPLSSIAYFRYYWDKMEPEEGQYNWELIDDLLVRARRCGQRLALRVSSMDGAELVEPGYKSNDGDLPYRLKVPRWYHDLGAPGAVFMDPNQPAGAPGMWEPDYESPLYLEKHGNLIRALGERYDGHPDLDHVDLGSVGRWGEWHCAAVPMPSPESRERIIDIYLGSFRKTPLLMLIGREDSLAYALQRGTGWRADCLGDVREGLVSVGGGVFKEYNHTEDCYLQRLVGARGTKAWKKAPVAFESCWMMRHWKEKGWCVDYIFSFALALHASVFNNKSTPVPQEWWPQADDFSRRMGYRLVLRRLQHNAAVSSGQPLTIAMDWENRGVAPCYRGGVMAFRLHHADSGREEMLHAEADIRTWLPGEHRAEEQLTLPEGFPSGRAQLSLALLDGHTLQPSIKPAVHGLDEDNWLPLGEVLVAR